MRANAATDESQIVLAPTATRQERLKLLQAATKKYVDKERERLTAEADALEKVLEGRTGGKGVQAVAVKYTSAVARRDLKSFLEK